ncbi:MAG: hypothetical protein ABR600_11570 [Actinomycetota bacterium]
MVDRRLPWLLSIPLMVAGSFAAHSLGLLFFGRSSAAVSDGDGGIEVARRADHGLLTVLPLVAGVAMAIVLVFVAIRVVNRLRLSRLDGLSPGWFLALPLLGYAIQEVMERLFHAEAVFFNPAHEPAFLAGLLLQLPFGVLAYLIGRAVLRLGTQLVRSVAGGTAHAWAPSRRLARIHPLQTIRPRIPVLALGHSVRGPPVIASA